MAESKTGKQKRMRKTVQRLRMEYPQAQCTLTRRNSHELLVATILSAQCTDERVNKVTQRLFRKYPSVKSFAYANVEELSRDIHSCGYHNQKAQSIKGSSLMILEEYGGDVPNTMEDLLSLPGVGRKTANCILGIAFNIPAVVIDTHMIRIMGLMGFVNSKNPEKIEQDVMEITLKEDWIDLTHLIIEHGRNICIAKRPKCMECILNDLCSSQPTKG
ncbi:MAG: endonuclease III [Candidatus Marinimicrobia bacterium]|nr:endonuclease III [Candidatus Neomarinimicrobiota bacterium]MBL7046797.1 endonuclease III [Candidatus Neomarinimicrobiota bacterium]